MGKKVTYLLSYRYRPGVHCGIFLVFVCLCFSTIAKAQVPVDLSGFDQHGEVKIHAEENLLNITWPAGERKQGRLVMNLQQGSPLFDSIQLSDNGEFHEIASDLAPAFLLTVGHRNLERNGWVVFFDNPAYRPHQSYLVSLNKENTKVVSDGSRTHIIIGGASAGPFSGVIHVTLFGGSPLMNVAAEMSTEKNSLAIIYDAGLVSRQASWKEIYWADPQNYVRDTEVDGTEESRNLAVKYRTIIGQSREGSIAVFPPPHQYFYPLDNAYNEQHVWFGRNYRGMLSGYGIGIRHDLLGDRRWVPWFNAPPGSEQKLNFFCLLSTQKDGKALEEVKRFTHGDTYIPLDGYYTMASHFHQQHTDDVLTHKPLPEMPGFVKAYRNTGVNIIHLGEFHLNGSPRGPEVKRFSELKTLFEECARLSVGNFLLLPGEEPNNWFGGHWMNLFPGPVYWVMSREEGEPFAEEHPEYGKVYRIGSKEDMLRLLEIEDGLAWTAHPRIKGSIGYPDRYKEEAFYRSDRFLGAAWKALPADLSRPELGGRALDLMDDMANWGQKKYMLAEADLFKIEPGYELYGHLNVNYLQLEELPDFEEGWSPVLEALRAGKFFATTGEVLLPAFSVNGKHSGQTATLGAKGKATINLQVRWTFPLNYAEIISGDGEQVYKEVIPLHDTKAFGSKNFDFSINLKGRKWVRVEVWDVAANGAFTQFVWLE